MVTPATKRALVLSGGGAKGSWQAGCIDVLLRTGHQYGAYFGVSVGAINALHLVQYDDAHAIQAARTMIQLWQSIDDKHVYKHHSWLRWLGLPWQSSVYSMAPLRKLLDAHYDDKRARASGKHAAVGAVNLLTGDYELHDVQGGYFLDAVMASAAFPVMFDPQHIGASPAPYLDGGIRNVTPLQAAIEWGAEAVDVIMCDAPGAEPWPHGRPRIYEVAARVLSLVMEEIIETDIAICQDVNRRLEQGKADDGHRKIELRVFRPDQPLPIGPLSFDPERIGLCIELGRSYMEWQLLAR